MDDEYEGVDIKGYANLVGVVRSGKKAEAAAGTPLASPTDPSQ